MDAVDIDPAVLELARQNGKFTYTDDRVAFYQGDLAQPLLELGQRYDLIVSNPPYIRHDDLEQLPALVKQEPYLALDGGADGLDFYRRLAEQVMPLLNPDGWLIVEHGDDQQEQVEALFAAAGWKTVQRIEDYGGRPRGLLLRPAKQLAETAR